MLFDDVANHFPMGREGGRIVPTVECISDTDSTPLGLSLRVKPITSVPLLEAGGTTQTTSGTSDGDDGEGTSTNTDSYSDEPW
jgi:hypothetical protein